MQYTVLLRQQESEFIATVPALPGCWARGKTRVEAVSRIQQAATNWWDTVEVTTIEVEVPDRERSRPQTWLQAAGCFQGNPDHEAHLIELAAERNRQRETA
jgi:predicted RNase H-like HicB family nuclease